MSDEQLAEEKSRADSNFRSCERIKDKLSECHNARKQAEADNVTLRAALENDAIPALRIAAHNARHNRIDDYDAGKGCWTTCPACVIGKSLSRIRAAALAGKPPAKP